MKKELRRDPNNKIIAGVCSGIAKYLDIDRDITVTTASLSGNARQNCP